jgi:uncharacterized SAM-binding protein YcdF (DUF218 family)
MTDSDDTPYRIRRAVNPVPTHTVHRFSAGYRFIVVLTCLFVSLCAYLLWNETDRIGHLLISPLAQRFQRSDIAAPDRLNGIIVLIGGFERLSEAGRLARQFPRLNVVISGAGEYPEALAELGGGIESSLVKLEMRSRNTYENAVYSTGLIRPQLGERWLLVTGASHMPRAIGSFRAAGFEVEPWRVHDLIFNNFQFFKVALHEWLGLLAYRLLGRTNALFPSPRNWYVPIVHHARGS